MSTDAILADLASKVAQTAAQVQQEIHLGDLVMAEAAAITLAAQVKRLRRALAARHTATGDTAPD